ncbi:hypothetical protein HDU91_000859, partial [Kappamyces sp. JEL0680]
MVKTISLLRESEDKLKQQVDELKADAADLRETLKVQLEKNSSDKDGLHGEIIMARQRQEETAGEAAHLKLSYDR